jgi:glyoxylase-like metal-dependent hydrolase (beta-lactamase superfamily II)
MKKNKRIIANAIVMCALALFSIAVSAQSPGAAGNPYLNMPLIAPIGVRIEKHLDVPESGKGPMIDPAKGHRIQKLGKDLYMITDNALQCMFMIYEKGVVLMDAREPLAQYIPSAIAEVTNKPITHLIYSHSHADHIGGAGSLNLGKQAIIIAHDETKRLLVRANDPARPVPTVSFKEKYTLKVGSQTLELSYHGNAHEPGNIFIYAPAQRTLMVVDIIFPGWMPWRRFALAQDIPGYFHQVEEINKMDWDIMVCGHVERTGTHADVALQLEFIDVALQLEFINDIRNTVRQALKSTKFIDGVNPADKGNPWAVFDDYIDRVVIRSVNELTPKWSTKLAALMFISGISVIQWNKVSGLMNTNELMEILLQNNQNL